MKELKNFSKTLIKYISLYSTKKESCLQKLGQEEKILRTKINDFTATNSDLKKRDYGGFRPGELKSRLIQGGSRNQNYFPKLKQEPRLKNFFKEDEMIRIPQKKLLTEEEEKSVKQSREPEMDWNGSPQSESDPLPERDEQDPLGEGHMDLSALRSEETLEFRRKPKSPNGREQALTAGGMRYLSPETRSQRCICCDGELNEQEESQAKSTKTYESKDSKVISIDLEQIYMNKNMARRAFETTLTTLKGLHKLLFKLMVNEVVEPEDVKSLADQDFKLLKLFLKKRKYKPVTIINLETLNEIRSEIPKKRSEEYVKYIFKKIIKFLKSIYREYVYQEMPVKRGNHSKNQKKARYLNFEYSFHDYYYGSVAKRMNINIEKFFHPRKNSSTLNRLMDDNKLALVEKSVSRIYLTYMKMSPKFVRHLNFYLEKVILNEIKHQIAYRLNDRLQNWEAEIETKGFESFYEDLKENFENNSRSKLCWSIPEVSLSINTFKKLLNETF